MNALLLHALVSPLVKRNPRRDLTVGIAVGTIGGSYGAVRSVVLHCTVILTQLASLSFDNPSTAHQSTAHVKSAKFMAATTCNYSQSYHV